MGGKQHAKELLLLVNRKKRREGAEAVIQQVLASQQLNIGRSLSPGEGETAQHNCCGCGYCGFEMQSVCL